MRLYLCIQPSLRPSIHLCILVIHYASISFTYAKNLTLFDNHFANDLCHCAIVPLPSPEDYPRKAFHWTMCQLNSMDRQHALKHHVHLDLSSEASSSDGSMLGPWISVLVTKEARNLRWNPQHLNGVFFWEPFFEIISYSYANIWFSLDPFVLTWFGLPFF